MHLLSEDIEKYIEAHSEEEDPVMKELNRETHLKVLMPQMLSGHVQGLFLEMVSKMIQPNCILEIGTFTGYAALALAKGLKPDGVLHTIDINAELEDLAAKYIQKAGMEDKVIQHIGKAAEIITKLNGPFDLVFIDADKLNYALYYDLVFEKVSPGGFIIADNVLWSGKVVEEKKDKDTLAIDAFNKKIKEDKRVEKMIVGIRDGLMCIRKR